MKKLPFGELAFAVGILLTAAGVALQITADLGLSMIASIAYILSEKFAFLTVGTAEWIVQGTVFALGFVFVGRAAVQMIPSFGVALLCGAVLDVMVFLFAPLQSDVLAIRLVLYLVGAAVLALGIAFAFRSYLPCQVHEMFVKVVAIKKGWKQNTVKLAYDWICLGISLTMTLLFFGKLVGIGIGTVICTIINAPMIAAWGKLLDRLFNFESALKRK